MNIKLNIKNFYLSILIIISIISSKYVAAETTSEGNVFNRADVKISFANVIKKVSPSVVNIYTTRKAKVRELSFFNDPFFSQFFGEDFFSDYYKERIQGSLGSGVIISPEGLILTNSHVIEGAENIFIILENHKKFEAEIIVKDKKNDLALLKSKKLAERKDINYAAFADSDNLEVGDFVIAIGNPYGIGQTVTSGIASGLARSAGISDYDYFIQTDAAINPGNSGGGLFDIFGKLVGISTAIYSSSGGSQGIGFAIPSNKLQAFINNVDLKNKRLLRPWSGLKIEPLNEDVYEALALSTQGIIIKSIAPSSPFASSGMREGDIITHINDHPIQSLKDFEYRYSLLKISSKANISYIRGSKAERATILVSSAPMIPLPEYTEIKEKSILAGATVANVSPFIAEELDIDMSLVTSALKDYKNFIVITSVTGGSYASYFGLKPGDIIINYNGVKIDSINTLKSFIKKKMEYNNLNILRNKQVIKITG